MALDVTVTQAWAFKHPRAAQPALDMVGIQAHRQALPDELARCAVLHAAHKED